MYIFIGLMLFYLITTKLNLKVRPGFYQSGHMESVIL